ncbi:T7SS effector LXG polymorphic toxin [Streptococcus equinus]|nr:T7SS effector LXG polymorphic toxin [Streptococcus equinus]
MVSENSDSAIVDTDVLQQMVDQFDSPLEQLKTSSDAINKAIDEVADIVALIKVTTDDAVSEFKGGKKVLTNTIKDMGIFNNTVFTSEVGDVLDEQNTQISSLSDLGSSSYTSKKAKNFYKKTDFKTEVKEANLVIKDKNRKARLKSDLAKELQVSKYSGYMNLSGARALEAAMPITLTWQKGAKINKTLSKPGGPSEKDLENIGVGIKEDKEILLYDNLYGYAKCTFESSASIKGKVAFTFNNSGLNSVKSGDTNLKNGEITLPVSGSAIENYPSYDVTATSKGIAGVSGSIGNEKSKTTYGVKYINGALAAYTSNESNFTLPQENRNGVPNLKEKVTFEQGQYLRDGGDGPHLTKYDYWVEKGNLESAGEIMKREATKSLEIGVMAVATVAVGAFVVSTFGIGGLAVGGLAGGALGLGSSVNHKEKKNEE